MPSPTMTLIQSVTVPSGGASSIDFTSIPSTYTDLVVKLSGRKDAGSFPNPVLQFNGDTSANYKWRGLYGDGTGANSNNSTSATSVLFGVMDGSSETASTFGSGEAYIPNYASSNQKSVSIEAVGETNASGAYMYMVAGLWTGTAAITSIKIVNASGNFVQYSTAYLYGVKNS